MIIRVSILMALALFLVGCGSESNEASLTKKGSRVVTHEQAPKSSAPAPAPKLMTKKSEDPVKGYVEARKKFGDALKTMQTRIEEGQSK